MVTDDGRTRMHWKQAIRESRLPATSKILALVLAEYAPGNGRGVWVPLVRLTDECSLTRNTTRAGMRLLIDSGYLTIEEPATGRRAARYRLTFPP